VVIEQRTRDDGDILPRAAVFRCPNGMLRSDTGSQTSISPSRTILKKSWKLRKRRCRCNLLVDSLVEAFGDVRSQASDADMLPIQIRIIFPLPKTAYVREASHEDSGNIPGAIKVFISTFV
jgi:hypothetical protein